MRAILFLLILCLVVSVPAFGAKIYAPGEEVVVTEEEESLEVAKVGTVAVPSASAVVPQSGVTVSVREYWEPHKNPGPPTSVKYNPDPKVHGPGMIQWMSEKQHWEPVKPGDDIQAAGHVALRKTSCRNMVMGATKVKEITRTETKVIKEPGETKYVQGPVEYRDRYIDRFRDRNVYIVPSTVQVTGQVGSPTVQSVVNPINITPIIGDWENNGSPISVALSQSQTQEQNTAQSQSTAVDAGGDGHGPCK